MQNVARNAVRMLQIATGAHIALDLEDPELRAGVESLFKSAGVLVARPDARLVAGGLVDVASLSGFEVVQRLRDVISQVPPGAPVVVVVRDGAGSTSGQALAQHWRPNLGLAKAHAEICEDAVIISGPRRAKTDNAHRRHLRGIGHDIEPTVLVGRSGLTDEVLAAVREAVERHGLIKVKLTPQASLDKKEAASDLAWSTGSVLVQQVGKTALLFRPDVELDPPAKRSGRR